MVGFAPLSSRRRSLRSDSIHEGADLRAIRVGVRASGGLPCRERLRPRVPAARYATLGSLSSNGNDMPKGLLSPECVPDPAHIAKAMN